MKFSKIFLLCMFLVSLIVVPAFTQEAEEEGIEVDAQPAEGNLEEDIVEEEAVNEEAEIPTEEAAPEEEEEVVEEPEVVLLPSSDVQTAFVFPDFPTQEFHAGDATDVVLGVTNTGVRALHFTSIQGSLYYHLDSKYIIENYTNPEIDVTVNPNEQRSISHNFRPHPMLDVGQFGLVFTAYYHDNEGGEFASVFFNQTIDIIEKEEIFDTDFLFRGSFVIALVLLGGFIMLQATQSLGRKTQKIERGTSSGSLSGSGDSSWLEGTSVDGYGKKKSQ